MWGAWNPLTVTGCVYISSYITEEQRKQLRIEATDVLRSTDQAATALLDSLINEILRLHPPAHSVLGVANQPFTMR